MRELIKYADITSLTKSLFGTAAQRTILNRQAVLHYVGTSLAILLTMISRRSDAVANPQFWAEDGFIFFRESLLYTFWDCLGRFYENFPYLFQRLIAFLALPFGIENAPTVYNWTALTTSSLALAFFSLPYFRHLIHSDYLRIAFCLVIVCLPNVGELVGVMTNTHWYLAIWASLVSLMQWPTSKTLSVVIVLFYFLSLFSAPVIVITTPLWILRVLNKPSTKELLATLTILATVVIILILSSNLGARPAQAAFNFLALGNLVTIRIVSASLVGKELTQTFFDSGWLYPLVLGFLAGLVWLSWKVKRLMLMLASFYFVVGSVILLLLGRGGWNNSGSDAATVMTNFEDANRYFVVGMAMLYLVILVVLDQLPLKSFVKSLCLIAILTSLAQSFILTGFHDYNWSSEAAKLSQLNVARNQTDIIVPINPSGWSIPFSVNIFPQPAIPLETKLAVQGEITQTFVSVCTNLKRIEVALTNDKPVTISLKNERTGQVWVSQTMNNDKLWQIFTFEPIANAKNANFRLTLSSEQTMTIWRSNQEAYPLGEGYVNSKKLEADIAFQYACTNL